MTAFIGYCLEDGAFLAADSQRNHYDTNTTSTVKKIVELTPQIVIATGGLGTIGHQARDELIDKVNTGEVASGDLNAIFQEARTIFQEAFEQSFEQNPGHEIPLYAIFAGQKPSDGTGFICAMRSGDDFEPKLFDEPGNPYFTGSDTFLVQEKASKVHSLLRQEYDRLFLDYWATKSIQLAKVVEEEIGYPVQLTLTDNNITERYPVSDIATEKVDRFKVNWDGSRV